MSNLICDLLDDKSWSGVVKKEVLFYKLMLRQRQFFKIGMALLVNLKQEKKKYFNEKYKNSLAQI